jgi:hypothetical protein
MFHSVVLIGTHHVPANLMHILALGNTLHRIL